MATSTAQTETILRLVQALDPIASKLKMRLFAVGGVVRDLFLTHEVHFKDFDFVVEGDARVFARAVSEQFGGAVTIFEPFLTAKIVGLKIEGLDHVDFATARTESYTRPGALPTVTPSSIDRDLHRRDFSINAIALPFSTLLQADKPDELLKKIVDPCAGHNDIARKELRILHTGSFIDDPTRMIRAGRYAARLSFELESKTRQALQDAILKNAFSSVTPQRLLNEIKKICAEHKPLEALHWLEQHGILAHLPIFELIEGSKLLTELSAPGGVPQGLSAEQTFDRIMTQAWRSSPPSTREAEFRAVGFGKAFFKRAS